MATIKGKWLFNETINVSKRFPNESLGYKSNGHAFHILYISEWSSGNQLIYHEKGTSYQYAVYTEGTGWSNEAYRTVDLGTTEQPITDTFLTWMTANAVQLEDEEPVTYCLYNGVKLPAISEIFLVRYPYCWIRKNTTSGNYDLVLAADPWYYKSGGVYCSWDGATEQFYIVPIATADSATGWTFNKTTTSYFTIDSNRTVFWSNHDMPNGSATATSIYFKGSEPVPIIEASPTTISYNGTELASLEEGQTATFPQGVKAKTDVSIAFGSKGSITYKGKTTEIEKGKTANLLCSGKKFGTDVVVAVEKAMQTNFTLSDGSVYVTSDGNVFIAKEA